MLVEVESRYQAFALTASGKNRGESFQELSPAK
jgi:hypothetical protein